MGGRVEKHSARAQVSQSLAEQRHEGGFRRPTVRDEDCGAGCFRLGFEDVDGDIAVGRGDDVLAGVLEEAARAADHEGVSGFAALGAMWLAEMAKRKVARALG